MASKTESTLRNMLLALFVVAFISATTLGYVYEFTKGPIATAKLKKKIAAIKKVVPEFTNDPNPPKDIFAIPIATNAPIIIIQTGKLLGTLNASNKPVIIAEPSVSDGCFLNMNFVIRYSKTSAETTDVKITIKAPIPKKYNDTTVVGINAISTPYIKDFIVSFP